MVQRFYARFLSKDYGRTCSVSEMLKDIGWDTLAERRAKAEAAMIYRIKKDLVDVPIARYLTPLAARSRHSENKLWVLYAWMEFVFESVFPVM